MVGRLNYFLRTTSSRFPKAAQTVKRLLGMPVESSAGATVWADPVSDKKPTNASGEAA